MFLKVGPLSARESKWGPRHLVRSPPWLRCNRWEQSEFVLSHSVVLCEITTLDRRSLGSQALCSAVLMLSAKSVLHVFANPEQYHFKPGVWYAINRPDGLAAIDGQHTVHCRLGLCKEEYDALLAELGLRGQQDTTWQSKIASQANAPRTFMDKASFDTVPSRARTVNRATARVRFGAVTLSQSYGHRLT